MPLCALVAAAAVAALASAACTPAYNYPVACPDLGTCWSWGCTNPTPAPSALQATFTCNNQLQGESVTLEIRNPDGVNVEAKITSEGCRGTSHTMPSGGFASLTSFDRATTTQSNAVRLFSSNSRTTACIVIRCWSNSLLGGGDTPLVADFAFGGTLSNPDPLGLLRCTDNLQGPTASGVGDVSRSRVAACADPRATTTLATRSGLVSGSTVTATVYNPYDWSIRIALLAGGSEITAYEGTAASRALSGTCNAASCALSIRCNEDMACVGLSFDFSVVQPSPSASPSRAPSQSASPSRAPSLSASPSRPPTPSTTASGTVPPTPSQTGSAPPTPSQTGSAPPTPSETGSAAPTPSLTASPTASPSTGYTESATMTPSNQPTPLAVAEDGGVFGALKGGTTLYFFVGGSAGGLLLGVLVTLAFCCCCRRCTASGGGGSGVSKSTSKKSKKKSRSSAAYSEPPSPHSGAPYDAEPGSYPPAVALQYENPRPVGRGYYDGPISV